jgi:phosphate starvation-inducible protein PhoH
MSKSPKSKKSNTATRIKNEMVLSDARPLTKNQGVAFDAWNNGQHLFMHGYSGTGKTFVALYLALRDVAAGKFRKLYIVRSAVPTRDQGFMPGSLKEKAEVYEAPYKVICTDLYGRGDAYEILKQKGIIEFVTTSYVRGITLDDCVIFTDEIQNLNFHELDSVITRTGEDTRLVFSGDVTQTDFIRDNEKNGLKQFMKIVREIPDFTFIDYGISDIVRSDIVRDYIIAKDRIGT